MTEIAIDPKTAAGKNLDFGIKKIEEIMNKIIFF